MKKAIFFLVLLIVLGFAGYFAYQNRHYFIAENKNIENTNEVVEKVSQPTLDEPITEEYERVVSDEVELTAEEISEWIGDYYFETIEAQGEGDYLAILELKFFEIDDELALTTNVFYDNLEKTDKKEDASYFGSLKWKDASKKVLVYSHEVTAGEDHGLGEPEMEIFKKDGKYFLTFNHIIPEHQKWPIEFQKVQKK